MAFYRLIVRYLPPYIVRLLIYILLNVLTSLFSIFSFATIIPVLRILFGLDDEGITLVDYESTKSISEFMSAIINNTLFEIQNQVAIHGSVWVLLVLSGFMVFMSALTNITSYFAYFVRIPLRTGISKDIRKDLYEKIVYSPIAISAKEHKGDNLSRITSDAEEVEYGIGTLLDMLIMYPVKIIVCVITLFGISAQLSYFVLPMVLFILAVLFLIGNKMKSIASNAQMLRGRMLYFFEETMGGIRTIKANNVEETHKARFDIVNDKARKTFNYQNRWYSLAYPATDFLLMVAMALILIFGGEFVLGGKALISADLFIYYLVVFYSIIPSLRGITKSTFGIRKAMASSDRITKILDIDADHPHSGSDVNVLNVETGLPLIEFSGVSFGYDESCPIIKKMTFSIHKGEKVLIKGAIGSGKTTILDLINGFFTPKEGNVFVGGVNVSNCDLCTLRNEVGYVDQFPMVFNDTFTNNISMGNDAIPMESIIWAAKVANIHDFILSTPNGYDTVVGENGACLSGGQRQCLAIARVVLRDPSILLLDEFSSSLDFESERLLTESLLKFMEGRTVVIVSHKKININFDHVYCVENGKFIDACNTNNE